MCRSYTVDTRFRGTKGSYQAWANIVGDRSYEYDQFQSYFKRSPQFTPPDYSKRGGPQVPFDTSAFDAQGGPLQVAYPNYYAPISDGAAKGFREVGIKEIPGLNSGNLIGYAEFTLSVDNIAAARSSSETSFLQDSLASGNLLYYQQTLAKQITFDSNKRATGVMVNTAGVQYLLSARKEVIVAAGAVSAFSHLVVLIIPAKSDLVSITTIADGLWRWAEATTRVHWSTGHSGSTGRWTKSSGPTAIWCLLPSQCSDQFETYEQCLICISGDARLFKSSERPTI